MTVKPKFNTKGKIKCLLWCQRHCCLCEKICDVDIEVAHIDQDIKNKEKLNNINNAIPLCYDCHAKIGHYNNNHPIGNKYSIEELKKRREQIYEKYTRNLVPPVFFEITQQLSNGQQRRFPDIGFKIIHRGSSLPVKALVGLKIFLGGKLLPKVRGHYSEEAAWNLNPQMGYNGHFKLPSSAETSTKRLKIEVKVTVIDQYERKHEMLPAKWIFDRVSKSWVAEP